MHVGQIRRFVGRLTDDRQRVLPFASNAPAATTAAGGLAVNVEMPSQARGVRRASSPHVVGTLTQRPAPRSPPARRVPASGSGWRRSRAAGERPAAVLVAHRSRRRGDVQPAGRRAAPSDVEDASVADLLRNVLAQARRGARRAGTPRRGLELDADDARAAHGGCRRASDVAAYAIAMTVSTRRWRCR